MRTINLSQRAARMLRENLTSSQEGYDYVDLLRLDRLAKTLTGLQGEYADGMAELGRRERQLRRRMARATSPAELEAATKELQGLFFEAEDLNEAGGLVEVELQLEEGDYRLVLDKLESVGRWMGSDELRHLVIGMVEAVKGATSDEQDAHVKPFKKRDHPA